MTKIVATIGPASEKEETLRKLILSGVNVFRFNMKHNVPKWHLEKIDLVQRLANELKVSVGIMIDLQGPEIRIETKENKDLALSEGQEILFVLDFIENSVLPQIRIPQALILEALEKGDAVSVEDGFYEFEIFEKVSDTQVKAKIQQEGIIQDRKSLNLIGKDIECPSIIKDDLDKLDATAKAKVDFVALSYARTTKDIKGLKDELTKRDIKAEVIAKIESQKGLDNIDKLIEVSDGIMIARGDLGIETPLESLVYHQKRIIKKCRSAGIPVIVATQMLQSMVERPMPTRAEAADVANAVYDETDCVMLSGETATGKYPIKTVKTMRKILDFNERHKKSDYTFIPTSTDQTHTIVNAAMAMLNNPKGIKIDMVLVSSETGYTARVFSSYRPNIPVIVLSEDEHTVDALTMSYGVLGYQAKFEFGDSRDTEKVVQDLVKEKLLKKGDTVLVVHGRKWKDPGNTNSLFIIQV